MIARVVEGMIGVVIGAVCFIPLRTVVSGLDTSGWSATEISMVLTILPLAFSIMVVVVVFMGLGKLRDG